MSNHYHIVIETLEANLSRGMRHLNGVYTQRFNRTHERVGHVFPGRFKAIVVDKDAYLLELSRYVVLNPVRAHMVEHACDWPWSSYLSTIGQVAKPDWLDRDWLWGRNKIKEWLRAYSQKHERELPLISCLRYF
jgi:hypothetical protein